MASENQAQEPVVVVISNEPPTTKQQLTTAAISIGTALAIPTVLIVGMGISSAVGKLAKKVKRTKAPADFPESTDDLSTEE